MGRIIRQAFVPAVGRVEYRDIEIADPGPGEVLIRPARIGICGSDVHVYKGEHPIVAPPLVQGHEVSGTVVALGPGVDTLAPGDVVAIEPAIGCGDCDRCAIGLMAQCSDLHFIGGDLEGPAGEAYVVAAEQLVRMAPTTHLDDAAMTEPLACAVHAVRRAGGVDGLDVIVTGGGPIGALVAQISLLQGARRVIVSDPSDGRRQILEACHLETFDPRQGPDGLRERFEGSRISVAFECSAAEHGLADCVRLLARGGCLVVVAVYAEPPRVDMVMVQDHELDVHGSLMYTWQDFREAARLIDEGRVRLAPLQTHHVPIERWADGYRLIDDPAAGAMKVLVDVT
jgi:L-iditol 2-dehydrogenase